MLKLLCISLRVTAKWCYELIVAIYSSIDPDLSPSPPNPIHSALGLQQKWPGLLQAENTRTRFNIASVFQMCNDGLVNKKQIQACSRHTGN